jgi:putative effector of murein hydrolase
MWADLVATPLSGITLTLVVYLLAQHLYRRVNSVWANPVLVSIVRRDLAT